MRLSSPPSRALIKVTLKPQLDWEAFVVVTCGRRFTAVSFTVERRDASALNLDQLVRLPSSIHAHVLCGRKCPPCIYETMCVCVCVWNSSSGLIYGYRRSSTLVSLFARPRTDFQPNQLDWSHWVSVFFIDVRVMQINMISKIKVIGAIFIV